MSVALDVNIVMAALWPASRRSTKSTGEILDAVLVGREPLRFTHVVFAPQDEATFYASSSEGVVYVFSLRGNSVKLFVTLESPISAMACCCGCSVNPYFLCALEDFSLVWIDRNTSRILRREKTPHQHIIHMICAPSGVSGTPWVSTISRESLAVWDAARMLCLAHSQITMASTLHNFMSVHTGRDFLLTVEWSGCVRAWNPLSLTPLATVVVEIGPRTAAACQKFIAIGGADAMVGFMKTDDLSSIGCVQISSERAATRSLLIINDELIACELTNGSIIFMVASSYTVAFAMAAPYSGLVPRRSSIFAVSGPSFAVFAHGKQLTLFHLPTARQFFLRRTKWKGVDHTSIVPSPVYPFLRRGGIVTEVSATRREDRGKPGDTTLPRPTAKPSPQQVSKWVKVDMLSLTTGLSKHAGSISEASPNNAAVSTTRGKKQEDPNSDMLSREKELSLRSFLDKDSREANMRILKRLLMRYGIFPEKYRPLTWRFLLQLPERRFTAPQYAQLLEKGPHPFTPLVMKPFPLSNKRLRGWMESVLSILIWHLPMLAGIHFLPMVLYPFLQVYEDDLQSVVEVVLVFLSNWGQEFFQYYPQHPVALMTLLNQMLHVEDVELHDHMKQSGVTVDEWGWGALSSLYTDILSSAAWLQVMDHALFNKPLWFFQFYIRWLVHIREELLMLKDPQELLAALTSSHTIDVNSVILETYRLSERFPEGELTRPYMTDIRSFVDYAYPTFWEWNEEALNQKLMDMKQSMEQRVHAGDSQQRIHDIYKQISHAENLGEVLIEKKRAQVAAQLSSASDSWRHEVAREKENQRVRDMENMARLQRMQQQVEQAKRLESIREEICSTRGQVTDLARISEKESLHWRRAERLTDYELRRLEDAARERLAKAMSAIEEDEKKALAPTHGMGSSVTDTTRAGTARGTSPPNVKDQRSREESSNPVKAYRILQSGAARGVTVTLPSPEEYPLRVELPTASSHGPAVLVADTRHGVATGPLYDNLLASGVASVLGARGS